MADNDTVVEASGIGIRFPGETRDAIRDVSLALRPGERVGILGPSGCGKSTFALALAGAIPDLIPATMGGRVTWPDAIPAGGGRAAFVQQDVEAQLVALAVDGEIAFALENRGLPPARIDAAIARALSEGPAHGLHAGDETLTLSTGWRQRLALSAALAEQASLTILDEPTAHLDEAAAQDAIAFVAAGAPGALLLIEHRADLVAPVADRVLVMDRDGSPLVLGPSERALEAIAGRPDLGLRLPPASRAALALRRHGHEPAGGLMPDVGALLAARRAAPAGDGIEAALISELFPIRPAGSAGPPVLRLDGVSLRRGGRVAIQSVSLDVGAGEIVGLAGRNGSGKTSLCLAAAGALRAREGRRTTAPGIVARMVPQNPSLVFASASLGLEAERRGLSWSQAEQSMESFGLSPDRHRYPLRHSRGELRRIALALGLAGEASVLAVLDEPTAGLDAHGLASLEARLEVLRRTGSGALVVSHDTDWLLRTCDRILVIEAGRIVAGGPAPEIGRLALAGTVPLAPPPGAALARALGLETAA